MAMALPRWREQKKQRRRVCAAVVQSFFTPLSPARIIGHSLLNQARAVAVSEINACVLANILDPAKKATASHDSCIHVGYRETERRRGRFANFPCCGKGPVYYFFLFVLLRKITLPTGIWTSVASTFNCMSYAHCTQRFVPLKNAPGDKFLYSNYLCLKTVPRITNQKNIL
jgi:hypothetical protein